MRSANLGYIPGLAEDSSTDNSIDLFQRMCRTRFFEEQAYKASEAGYITCPVYLSSGQESISAAISTVLNKPYIFAQHRAHSVYLAFGGNIERLIDELLGLPTGCCGGMGGSPPIQDPDINMIGHEGLIGHQVPIAVGTALGKPDETVVCFLGDGAVEEDYIFGALGFAATHSLKILFVCEDNDLSVLTETQVRRNWEIVEIVKSLGIKAIDVADDPWVIQKVIKDMSSELPAFINCRTCRYYWHVGAGNDGPPEWDRYNLVKEKIEEMGLKEQLNQIEYETQTFMRDIWAERLRIQLEN
jgi:acetoin:2,6-dichlorophenolindophenol oxidoreductase subunit alpha